MMTVTNQQLPAAPSVPAEPAHIMTRRQHYEQLAREAADQK